MASLALEADSPRFGTAWLRFCAVFVDGVVVGVPIFLLQELAARWDSLPALVALSAVLAAADPAYTILLHGRYGQTLGKRLLRVKVLDVGQGPLSMRQAVLRDVPNLVFSATSLVLVLATIGAGTNPFAAEPAFGWLDGLMLAWFLADGVTLLLSSRRRALHDLLARSVVVRLDVA